MGATLAVAFVLMNVVVVAGIIMTMMLKGKGPGEELRVVINVFAFLSSAWYSVALYRKEKHFRS